MCSGFFEAKPFVLVRNPKPAPLPSTTVRHDLLERKEISFGRKKEIDYLLVLSKATVKGECFAIIDLSHGLGDTPGGRWETVAGKRPRL